MNPLVDHFIHVAGFKGDEGPIMHLRILYVVVQAVVAQLHMY